MKTQIKDKDILFPVPSALVVSGTGANSNIITIAWIGKNYKTKERLHEC